MRTINFIGGRRKVISKSRFNKRDAAIFAGVFAIIGSIILLVSHAAGNNAAVEPENGTLASGVTIGADSTASGGKYVQFGGTSGAGSTVDIVAVGDIACGPTSTTGTNMCRQKGTSDLAIALDKQTPLGAVLVLGDNQYESSLLDELNAPGGFNDTWGRLKPKIKPVPGNHEWDKSSAYTYEPNANPNGDPNITYCQYFGGTGPTSFCPNSTTTNEIHYYSYNLGPWHFVALDGGGGGTSATTPGGCARISCATGSPEETWLKNDLANNHQPCTLAYWHQPLWSSGEKHNLLAVEPFWDDLYAAHADIVLGGHDHDYERYNLVGPRPGSDGEPVVDPNGIREFIVGTGGKDLDPFAFAQPTAEQARASVQFGILHLSLKPNGYNWNFIPDTADGSTYTDSGSQATCHNAA